MIVMGMVPVSPEIPRPFMSIETTDSSKPSAENNGMAPMPGNALKGSRGPTLGKNFSKAIFEECIFQKLFFIILVQCLWSFFKCDDTSACQKDWDKCMMDAMRRNGP